MFAAVLDTASYLFLLLIVVLVFSLFVAVFAPPVARPPRLGFYTVLLYLALEVAALVCAVMIVSWISDATLLPTLLALAVAAAIFMPKWVARIPVPAAVTGFLDRK